MTGFGRQTNTVSDVYTIRAWKNAADEVGRGEISLNKAALMATDLLDALPVAQDLAAGHKGKDLLFVDGLEHLVNLGFRDALQGAENNAQTFCERESRVK